MKPGGTPRVPGNRRPFFTFLGDEGCQYLADYVEQRRVARERITRKSPVLTPTFAGKPFIRTNNVGDLIRKPMRAAELSEAPYVWRNNFSSRAMLAESRGFLRDYREFVMGHSPDISRTYSMSRRLPADTVEAMRRGYQAALEHLQTTSLGQRQR